MCRRAWIVTVIVSGSLVAMTVFDIGGNQVDRLDTTNAHDTTEASVVLDGNQSANRPRGIVADPPSHESRAPNGVVSIRFFDGETAQLIFRAKGYDSISFPDRLSTILDEWKDAAMAGDAGIARALYESLDICRGNTYESDQQFAAMMDRFQQTHVIPKTIGGEKLDVPVEPTAEAMTTLHETYDFCKGIDQKEVESADTWRKIAAEGGNVTAQYSLGQQLLDEPEGRAFLEAAWNSGHIDAAGWLAKSLAIPTAEMPGDLISAYAYKALYAELVRADFESRGTADAPFSKAWMEGNAKGLATLERQLRPSELRQAHEMVKKLYSGNKNCCMWR